MGPIVRLIGQGIGLASEARAARKQKKSDQLEKELSDQSASTTAQENVVDVSHDEYDEMIEKGHAVPIGHTDDDGQHVYGDTVEDEEDWELDEAGENADDGQDEKSLDESQSKNQEKLDVGKILQKFLLAHPLAPNFQAGKLPYPVIIPQRRPRTKARGFVRAYAPVLANSGIDQDTWMNFLEAFDKSSQASPIFTGILIAGNIIGFVPSATAMIAAITIKVTAVTAIVVQSRSRTNTFLDDVNEKFFRPRGLYALLIQYRGSRHKWSSEPLDVSHSVTKNVTPSDASKTGNLTDKFKHSLQFSSGKSHGEMEMPESAPLIYPALDAAAAAGAAASSTDQEKPKSKIPGKERLTNSTAFVNTYLDRRAQAVFAHENPTSSLTGDQKPTFASRYADPNHPASSGSLVSLLTGGHVDPRGRRRRRDEQKKDWRGFYGPLGALRHYQPVKRALRQGVLYLMVVNMPTEAELAKARAEMEKQVKVEGDEVVVVGEEGDEEGEDGKGKEYEKLKQ